MRPHVPATDGVCHGDVVRTNQLLAIPRAVVLLQARLIIPQVFHSFPAVMIVRAAQVIFFLVGPDLILEIIRRTTGSDATAVIGIIVNFRVFIFGSRDDGCS